MTKQAFLDALRAKLAGIPQDEIEEQLSFYAEMIDDRIEDGVPEEDAVAGVGDVDEIAAQILAEIPLTVRVVEKVRPKRKPEGWEVALLILGFPVWLPLLIAAAAVAFSLYVVLWSLVISLFAVDLAFAATAVAGIPLFALYVSRGNPAGAVFMVGTALVCAGLAILLFYASVAAAKGVIALTKRIFVGNKGNNQETEVNG